VVCTISGAQKQGGKDAKTTFQKKRVEIEGTNRKKLKKIRILFSCTNMLNISNIEM